MALNRDDDGDGDDDEESAVGKKIKHNPKWFHSICTKCFELNFYVFTAIYLMRGMKVVIVRRSYTTG